MTTGWTTPADVIARLRRRWDGGEFLRSWAQDLPFEIVRVPISGPSTAQLSTRLAAVRSWVEKWAAVDIRGVRVTTRMAGLRSIGANAVPSHVEVDGYDGLWRLLGVQALVRHFAELRTATEAELGNLVAS